MNMHDSKRLPHPLPRTRRDFLKLAGTGAAVAAFLPRPAYAPPATDKKSVVSLVKGADRRQMVYDSLKPFKQEVAAAIGRKQVVIKANAGMIIPENAKYSTHADELRGILDFLKEIHDRKILIIEGCAATYSDAFVAFENYGYLPLRKEYGVTLLDGNEQPSSRQYIRAALNFPQPINIINIFMDPNVYLISAARMKTHNAVVATYSLKNVVMGSPVCHWREKNNEKSLMHGGKGSNGGKELSYNLFSIARLGVTPDLAIIDGIEATEGNGPWEGDIVEHGVVVASTDFVAADRICTELMGIDPNWMKYLEWCSAAGMGTWDINNITVNGPNPKDLAIKYKLHSTVEKQVAWIHENFGQ
jgi:uncharacterized protein (DUF362 family)